MVIAYEPIWAIGTGKDSYNGTGRGSFVKQSVSVLQKCMMMQRQRKIRIQYGGSVNAGNAAELFARADIDGGLVGGASLKADFGKSCKLLIFIEYFVK